MQEYKSFDPHAKILHRGQYFIKQSQTIPIPIKSFDAQLDEENSVRLRIEEMKNQIRDLEQQINVRRKMSEDQAEEILSKVKDEARKVMEEAEKHAFDKVQKSLQEKESLLQQTNENVDKIIVKAEEDARGIISNAEQESISIRNTAQKDGWQKGYEDALEDGKTDISYMVERLHSVVAETARERERILVHSENQVINLVLTMVGKVVKKMTAEHKEVVVENTKAALELLRGAMTIFIRVSPHDFNYLTSFKEYLTGMIESRADLKFIEDPMIEPGGVFIESEMGDIDATIRSQLEELESQMRFYMPVKVKTPENKNREQKINKEREKTQKYEELVNSHPEPTPFAQREEFISSKSYEDTVTESSEQENSLQNVSSNEISESETTSSLDKKIEILSDKEIHEDPLFQEALETYKDVSEDVVDKDASNLDEDVTI